MGLFSWFWRLLRWFGFGNKQEKLLIVGLDNAGKTTLLHSLKTNQFVQFDQTTTYHSEEVVIDGVSLRIFDLGGHKQIRNCWENYYINCGALVFVVDAACPERIEEAKTELQSILNNDSLKSVPILILGNKVDIAGSIPMDDLKKSLGIGEPSDGHRPIRLVMASAKQRFGYPLGFRWLVKQISQ